MNSPKLTVYTSVLLPDAEGNLELQDVTLVVSYHYHNQKGSYSLSAPSDWDFYGYEELDYTIESACLTEHPEKRIPIHMIDFEATNEDIEQWIRDSETGQD